MSSSASGKYPRPRRASHPFEPTTKTQVRAFLGLAGYYLCFIPNFSSLASPLTDLTRKGTAGKRTLGSRRGGGLPTGEDGAHLRALLRAPDFSCPFLVANRCVRHRVGGCPLTGTGGRGTPGGLHQPKAVPLRKQRYAAVEKEALAVKWAVLELRYYYSSAVKFTLITDMPFTVDGPGEGHQREGDEVVPGAPGFPLRCATRAGTANANADGLSGSGQLSQVCQEYSPQPQLPRPPRGPRSTLGGGWWRMSRALITLTFNLCI